MLQLDLISTKFEVTQIKAIPTPQTWEREGRSDTVGGLTLPNTATGFAAEHS